jgi:hypothetical protein
LSPWPWAALVKATTKVLTWTMSPWPWAALVKATTKRTAEAHSKLHCNCKSILNSEQLKLMGSYTETASMRTSKWRSRWSQQPKSTAGGEVWARPLGRVPLIAQEATTPESLGRVPLIAHQTKRLCKHTGRISTKLHTDQYKIRWSPDK